jgi:hypothetical protein
MAVNELNGTSPLLRLPIDESFMPKELTAVASSENLCRRLSGTDLPKLQEERKTFTELRAANIFGQHKQRTSSSGWHDSGEHESRVLVLYTGGTIGMQAQADGGLRTIK